MRERVIRRQEAFLRVREFGIAHAAVIPANSLATTLLANLNQIITRLEEAGAQQSSGERAEEEATASKSLAREETIEDLMRISRTARAMRQVLPGLEDKFRSPGQLKDQELLALARAYAADALPLKDEFIRRGMPADFIDELNEDIDDFEAAIARQMQAGSSKVSATASIEDLATQGMETLRELDPIMRNIFEGDAARYAAWTSARHIERAPRRRPADTPQAPQPNP